MFSYKVLFLWILLFLYTSFTNANSNKTFPQGFLFGVATAAYQIEGAWNVDGKGENMWDRIIHTNPSFIVNNDTADIACDSYHKYEEDVALIADLGAQFYRFSISWSRVFPTGYANETNLKGISYYQKLIQAILNHNLIPVVTLYHWDLPQPLQDIGGWTNPEMVNHFVDYARVVIGNLDGVQYWVTFNEPRLICKFGYGSGVYAPALYLDGTGDYMCSYVLLKAHAATYHMYKTDFPESTGKMSIVLEGQWSEPATTSTDDQEAAERKNQFEFGLYANPIFKGNWPQVVIDRVKFRSDNENVMPSRLPQFTQEEIDYINGTFDYLGFNTYFTEYASNIDEPAFGVPSFDSDMRVELSVDPSWSMGTNGKSIVPWGIRKYLQWIKKTYGDVDIFVTENGVADNGTLEDYGRIQYYIDYLGAVLDAINQDGVKVIGYAAWSLLDNFEWIDGYSQHFGLYSVDFSDPNRTRTPKKSASFFRKLATTLQIPDLKEFSTTSSASSLQSLRYKLSSWGGVYFVLLRILLLL